MLDPRYTLIQEFDNNKITVEFDAIDLPTVFENFEYFLKGCGFVFEGNIDIVEDNVNIYKKHSLVDPDERINIDYDITTGPMDADTYIKTFG